MNQKSSNEQFFVAELEQQVLGAVLMDGARVDQVRSIISLDSFFDPVHRDIFKVIRDKIDRDELVSPVTVSQAMQSHEGLGALGGSRYLVNMGAASVSGSQVALYAQEMAEAAAKRSLHGLLMSAVSDLQGQDAKAGEVSARLEGALGAIEAPTKHRAVPIGEAAARALKEAVKAYQGEGGTGVLTGIPSLDRMMGGFHPGELILLGGRPSMGKTAVALAMALNMARNGDGVAIASLEMTPESMSLRAISEQTAQSKFATPYAKIRRGDLTEDQMKAAVFAGNNVKDLPIMIMPQSYRDIGALYAGAKRIKAQMPELKVLIVDYLQLMRAPGANRFEQIAEISIALKSLALQLNIPVIALSQLSRAVESRDNKRPVLSDLRESGQLEQDADAVLFCYRGEYYLERDEPDADDIALHDEWRGEMDRLRNRLEIIVSKQRQGEIGTAHVMFNPALNLIWEN